MDAKALEQRMQEDINVVWGLGPQISTICHLQPNIVAIFSLIGILRYSEGVLSGVVKV